MFSPEEIKKLTRKELTEFVKQLCTESAEELYFKYDVDFVFDHYDNDLKIIYVRETESTENPVTYEMLDELLSEFKKINSRMQVGIFFEEVPKGDS
tara:strand:+ start:6023 stop:6310 length:288 start_codon:yes stop_codon:yes gene_type:complete